MIPDDWFAVIGDLEEIDRLADLYKEGADKMLDEPDPASGLKAILDYWFNEDSSIQAQMEYLKFRGSPPTSWEELGLWLHGVTMGMALATPPRRARWSEEVSRN